MSARKHYQKYREEYELKWPFIRASRKGEGYAYCTLCHCHISIRSGGHNDLLRHVGTEKHLEAARQGGDEATGSMDTQDNDARKSLRVKAERSIMMDEDSETDEDYYEAAPQKKMKPARSRRSDVWQFMQRDERTSYIKCTLCDVIIPPQSKGSTSSMRSHLYRLHSDKYTPKNPNSNYLLDIKIKREQELRARLESHSDDDPGISQNVSTSNHMGIKAGYSAGNESSTKLLPRKTVNERLLDMKNKGKTSGRPVTHHSTINNMVFSMIVGDLLPVSIVDGEGFQKLLTSLERGYILPSKAHLETRFQKMLKFGRMRLGSKFGDQKVGLTVNLWSGYNNRNFITLTASVITNDWKNESWVLGTIEICTSMTDEDVAKQIKNLCQKCGIQEDAVMGLVYGTELRKLVGDTSEVLQFLKSVCSHFSWECRPCINELLTTCLQTALSIPPVTELINKCEALMSHVNAQPDIQEKLFSILQERNQEAKLQVCNVSSKWQLIYDMLSQLSELKEPITQALDGLDVNLTGIQWKFLHEVLHSLRSVKAAFAILGNGRNKSVSCWLPVVHKMLENIDSGSSASDATEDGQVFFFKLTLDIQARCELNEVLHSSYVMQATAVDPRFHNLSFLSAEDIAKVIDTIKTQLAEENGDSKTNQKTNGKEGSAYFDLFGEDEFNVQNAKPEDEIDRFRQDRPASRDTDPLQWWHVNEKSYSLLGNLAKSTLCIPALASTLFVSNEAGNDGDDHKRLKFVKNVDAQLFIHHNAKLFKEVG